MEVNFALFEKRNTCITTTLQNVYDYVIALSLHSKLQFKSIIIIIIIIIVVVVVVVVVVIER